MEGQYITWPTSHKECNMEKKKIFEYPEALIVEFNADDIILTSGDVGVWWGGKDGDEFWDD